jgi:alkanesulfonate monooxygenase SsuD/methylene tetrahydromethanopterin reductase-like flavin-dependent oxidoreductase (luciferase family)
VFVSTYLSLAAGVKSYAEAKAEIAAIGRNPDDVTICPSLYTVAAETRAEAEDKMALNDRLYEEVDALSLLSEAMNFDFARKGLDEPFTDEELAGISGTQSMRDRVLEASGIQNPTVRDFIKFSSRARPRNPFVGSGKDVADRMEEWFTAPCCDGFVLAADNIPGSYEDFVKFVVPELQRRGLYHLDYKGATLRENLGLARPARGDWKL